MDILKPPVTFTCTCGTVHSKSKRAFDSSGPFCKYCTQRNTAIKKIKNKISLNNKLILLKDGDRTETFVASLSEKPGQS